MQVIYLFMCLPPLSDQPLQKIIIKAPHLSEGLKLVNSIFRAFCCVGFPQAAAQGDFHTATYAAFIGLPSGGNWVSEKPV